MKPAPLRRAKRGSIGATFLLKLDAELAAQVRDHAKKAGITVTEAIRRAIRAWLKDDG